MVSEQDHDFTESVSSIGALSDLQEEPVAVLVERERYNTFEEAHNLGVIAALGFYCHLPARSFQALSRLTTRIFSR